jgi:methionyl-tRNA formyltransferase
MRIIFMGTPDFAVASLKILVESGFEIAAVITMPDKQGGRKGLLQSAVKQYALAQGLLILQPEKLKNPEFVATLRELKADLQVVVAFRMLPEIVWNMPPKGTMNLHGSLLPKYRGAAPINWAIINGEKETGVTTFLLQHEIDTGDMLFQEKIPIGENETAGDIHDKLMELGANLVLKSVKAIEKGEYTPQPQPDTEATHAPKIFTETCQINFNQSSQKVHDFIRGLSPFPGAWTTFEGKNLKISLTKINDADQTLKPEKPGEFYSDNKKFFKISTKDGYIDVLEMQIEGKKRMSVKDFLNGLR